MIETFFAIFAACTAEPTVAADCAVAVSPFWFESEEGCELWMERELPMIMALNGFASPPLVETCLSLYLPIPTGDPT